jgi:SAM-dependent methyltransferase
MSLTDGANYIKATHERKRARPTGSETHEMTGVIACPACDGRRVRVIEQWPLGGKHQAVACDDCGLLFVHPPPPPEALEAYYAPDGGWQASRTQRSAKPPSQRTKHGASMALFAVLDSYFPVTSPQPGARVFDFGCGLGVWLNSLQDRGWETYGLEPSTDYAFTRHKQLHAIPSEPQFDLVLAYHVLEHLPRPLDTIRQLATVLLPGAHLFVSVPRLDALAIHGDVKYCLHRRNHIVAFTEMCLRGLLARAGLQVVAALHGLDAAFTKGQPLRLRLVARKTDAPLTLVPDPAAQLRPVIDAVADITRSR